MTSASFALSRSDLSATVFRMRCGRWSYAFAGRMYSAGGVDMKRIVALLDPATGKSRTLGTYVHADVGVIEERRP